MSTTKTKKTSNKRTSVGLKEEPKSQGDCPEGKIFIPSYKRTVIGDNDERITKTIKATCRSSPKRRSSSKKDEKKIKASLGNYGYTSTQKNAETRRKILDRIIKEGIPVEQVYNILSMRLNLLSEKNKNSTTENSIKNVIDDLKYVQEEYSKGQTLKFEPKPQKKKIFGKFSLSKQNENGGLNNNGDDLSQKNKDALDEAIKMNGCSAVYEAMLKSKRMSEGKLKSNPSNVTLQDLVERYEIAERYLTKNYDCTKNERTSSKRTSSKRTSSKRNSRGGEEASKYIEDGSDRRRSQDNKMCGGNETYVNPYERWKNGKNEKVGGYCRRESPDGVVRRSKMSTDRFE